MLIDGACKAAVTVRGAMLQFPDVSIFPHASNARSITRVITITTKSQIDATSCLGSNGNTSPHDKRHCSPNFKLHEC